MRIRTIKPEFWSHPVLSAQEPVVRLGAIGLLNFADDHGYFLAKPALVRSALFPLDEDSTNARRILAQLSMLGYIEVSEHPAHGEVGRVVNFTKHQKVDRPSPSRIAIYFDSSNIRRTLDDHSLLYQVSRYQGNREQGGEQEAPPAPASPIRTRAKDEWKYAEGEPWVRVGRKAGCDIKSSNWELWGGAIARSGGNHAEFFAVAESMPPGKRWPEKIESAMSVPKQNATFGPRYLAWVNTGEGPEPQAHE